MAVLPAEHNVVNQANTSVLDCHGQQGWLFVYHSNSMQVCCIDNLHKTRSLSVSGSELSKSYNVARAMSSKPLSMHAMAAGCQQHTST